MAPKKKTKRLKKSDLKALQPVVERLRSQRTFSIEHLKARIGSSGALIEELMRIRTMLGDTPELAALIASEAAILRELINALLTARGIVITPVITVSDADIVSPAVAANETVG